MMSTTSEGSLNIVERELREGEKRWKEEKLGKKPRNRGMTLKGENHVSAVVSLFLSSMALLTVFNLYPTLTP